jgi:hypothetical protein
MGYTHIYIYIYTHKLMGGIYEVYSVEMDLRVMIYIPSFIQIDSAIRKLIRDTHRYRDMDIIVVALAYF